MLADATDREHEILGAIPYQPNEAVLHTDRALLPRRRRAWASWNYHLLPEPTGMTTVTYHMNRLQALDADREFCVTLNRSDAIDPGEGPAHDLRTRIRSSPPRARAPRRATTRSAGATARTTRAPTGAGASTRTASSSARARRRALRGAPVTRRCTRARSATGASPCASTSSATGSRSPTPTSTPRRAGKLPRSRRRSRRSSARPLRPIRLLTMPRSLGVGFNPVSFYYCFDATDALDARRRRGHQHALGRAPRLRAAAGPAGRRTRRCTSRRSWAWTTTTRSAPRRRARRSRCTSRAAAPAQLAFDATLNLEAPPVQPPPARRRLDPDARAHLRPRGRPQGQGRPDPLPSANGGLVMLLPRLARGLVCALLERIESGQLTLVEDGIAPRLRLRLAAGDRRRPRPARLDRAAARRQGPRRVLRRRLVGLAGRHRGDRGRRPQPARDRRVPPPDHAGARAVAARQGAAGAQHAAALARATSPPTTTSATTSSS